MGQPKFITAPSYDLLHVAAIQMTREVRTMAWIDAIVAPMLGGLFFGTVASRKLNVPLFAVSYSSKTGAGDDKNHDNILPTLPPKVHTILLVDDICDTGRTLSEITSHYTQQGIKVLSAVYHFKEDSAFKPDLYFWRIPADSEFIQYPNENT